MDLFDLKSVKPMLVGKLAEPFDDKDFLYELKLDGIRCIAYLDTNETELINKRDKRLLPHVPELSNIHKSAKEKCILDGELIIMAKGVPDFYAIQRRALLSDPFKIKLAADKLPATFVAYDCLYYKNELITNRPLLERKRLLEDLIPEENAQLSISRFLENHGVALFELAKQQNLEGIIAKRKDSLYKMGKRSDDWVKSKVLIDDDYIVCGYIEKPNHIVSLVLGQYVDGILSYKGHVTLGANRAYQTLARLATDTQPPFCELPPGNQDAIWITPHLVCTVLSMPSEVSEMRQPIFKAFRDDKKPEECVGKEEHDFS